MQISRLAVRLEGFAVVGGHSGPRSSGHTLQREVVVTGEEALLDSGEHRYKFLLDVPTSTAAKETNWHGRIRHSLVAIAETPALFFKPLRSEVPIDVVAILNEPGEPLPDFSHELEQYVEELGPLRIVLRCVASTVAAPVLAEVFFASPPADTTILSIALYVRQHFHLIPYSARKPFSPPREDVCVFRLDASTAPSEDMLGETESTSIVGMPVGLCELAHGEPRLARHLARLPDGRRLRPSTLDGTQTPINVSHTVRTPSVAPSETLKPLQLELEIDFEVRGQHPRRKQRAAVSRPLTLLSCMCLASNLVAPEFTTTANTHVQEKARARPARWAKTGAQFATTICVCGLGEAAAIEQHRSQLLLSSLPADAPRMGPEYL